MGIGKMIAKVATPFLEKVGLGKLAPVLSGVVNAVTGNWVGVAADVANLANRLTNGKLGFLNKIAQFASIGQTFMGGGANIGDLFKSGGLQKLAGNLKGLVSGNLKNILGDVKNIGNTFKGGLQAFQGGNPLDGATKILKAFDEVNEFVKNKQAFTSRSLEQNIQLLLGQINQPK